MKEEVLAVSSHDLLNTLLESVKQASHSSEINIHHLLELYDHCLDFALMNHLFERDCELLVETFSNCMMPLLLKGGHEQLYDEKARKLKEVLGQQGDRSQSSREKLNQIQLEKARDLVKAVNGLPLPDEFRRLQVLFMGLLSEANNLIKSEGGLAQFFTALETLIHLSLQGYQNITYLERCKLLAEAIQYSCSGLSLAQKRNCLELGKRFEMFTNITFAYYFALHAEFKKGDMRPYLMDVLYYKKEKLEMLNRMFQAADLLLMHAVLLVEDKNQQTDGFINAIERAKWLYHEIITNWGTKDKNFAEIGTKALSRMSAIAECQGNPEHLQQLKGIISCSPVLISWQENRKALKTYRDNAKTLLKNTPIGDTLSVVKQFNQDIKGFTQSLLKECLSFMGGDLPFKYAILRLGSAAREEACPYSDVEYAFLVEEEGMNEINKTITKLFLGLFEISVYALGETPEIPELKARFKIDLQSHIPAGFQFDGNYMVLANLKGYQSKQLWGTAEVLLSSMNDLNVGNMMQGASLLFAGTDSDHLYPHFQKVLAEKFDQPSRENLAELIRKSNGISTKPFAKTALEINIKDSLLQLPIFLLNILNLQQGFSELSSLSKLEKLQAENRIDPLTAEMVRLQLVFSLRLRYLSHLHYGEEQDMLNLQLPPPFLDESLLKLLEAFRKGILPVLHHIFTHPEKLQTIQPQDYQLAIPVLFMIAEDYFSKNQWKEAFKYYDLIVVMMSSVGPENQAEFKEVELIAMMRRGELQSKMDQKISPQWGTLHHFYQKPKMDRELFPVTDDQADFNPSFSRQSENKDKKPEIQPRKRAEVVSKTHQQPDLDFPTTQPDSSDDEEPNSGLSREKCLVM
jgi:hypothetical protein